LHEREREREREREKKIELLAAPELQIKKSEEMLFSLRLWK
jgi:hypothetical protein